MDEHCRERGRVGGCELMCVSIGQGDDTSRSGKVSYWSGHCERRYRDEAARASGCGAARGCVGFNRRKSGRTPTEAATTV